MILMRGLWLQTCLLVAISACGLTACGGARARFTSHLHRGQEYLAAGNLDKASVEFRNAAQIEPKNAEALYYNGRVAEARNDIRSAFSYYQAAVEANPRYPAARAGVGKILVLSGSAKRAMDEVAPGLAEHPDDVDLLAVRAAARHQLKEDEAALVDAERAAQLGPTNENAVSVLAALYTDTKQYSRAISLLQAAVAHAPDSIPLREVLTNLYLSSGDAARAEEQIRKIIEIKPLELAPRTQLALHLIRAHDLDGAQRVLEEAVRALSTGAPSAKVDEARLQLVDFISRERSREQGEKTLRDFIAHEPDNLELRLGLGMLLQRVGAFADALSTYQDLIKRDGTGPKGLLARDRMAAIHLQQGHADMARKLLAEVLLKNPRDDDALILRSTLEMQQNDPTGAIADLRAVLRDQPKAVALQRALASAYLAKGQSALAEEALRAGMKTAPNDPLIRIELARLLVQTERAPQGVALLEETVKLLPDQVPAREALLRTYMATGNLQDARAAAEQLQKQQPRSAIGFYYAGLIAAREKRLDDSLANLQNALALQPDGVAVLSALAQVKLAAKDPEGAVAEYRAALKLAPSDPQLVSEAARLYEKQGRIDDAIAGYDALYKANQKAQQFAANNLAMLLVTYKKDPASLDRALDLTSSFSTSDNGSLLDTVGWVRFKRGEYQDALSALERAMQRAPDSKVIRFHLAMTELQLGFRDRARSNLESALTGTDSFQGSDEARTALATLKARA